ILAEAAQNRIHTTADAENWWRGTLAYHQGSNDLVPVHEAIRFLVEGGYLTAVARSDNITLLTVTGLGKITTRFMVPVEVGADLRAAHAAGPAPTTPGEAEWFLGQTVATLVPQLAEAPVSENLLPLVARLLRARGHLDRLDSPPPPGLTPATAC